MLHRISQLNVEEVNRVLKLVQENAYDRTVGNRGVSERQADLNGTVESKNKGIFIIKEVPSVGLTNILPINLTVTVSQTYPTFGYGSQWGNNWGL